MLVEPHHYTLSELVSNKANTCYRFLVHHTHPPNSTFPMGRRYIGTIWLRVPTTSNIGLYPIWNRFNRDSSPCERYDFIYSPVEEE